MLEGLVSKAKIKMGETIGVLTELSEGLKKSVGDKVKKAQESYVSVNKEVEVLKSEIAKLGEKKKDLLSNIVKAEEKIQSLYDEYHKSIANKQQELISWGVSLSDKENALGKRTNEIHSTEQMSEAKLKDVTATEERVDTLECKLKEEIKKYRLLQSEEEGAKNSLDLNKVKVDKLLAETEKKNQDCKALEQDWIKKNNTLLGRGTELDSKEKDIREKLVTTKDKENELLLREDSLSKEEAKIAEGHDEIIRQRTNLQAKDDNLKVLEKELRAKYENKK